jgi:hypothetical protein
MGDTLTLMGCSKMTRDEQRHEGSVKCCSIQTQIENTSGLSQGVSLSEEMLTSIAISLCRIAGLLEDQYRRPNRRQYPDDDGQFGVGA